MNEVVIAILLAVGLIAAAGVVVAIGIWLPRLQQGRRAERWVSEGGSVAAWNGIEIRRGGSGGDGDGGTTDRSGGI